MFFFLPPMASDVLESCIYRILFLIHPFYRDCSDVIICTHLLNMAKILLLPIAFMATYMTCSYVFALRYLMHELVGDGTVFVLKYQTIKWIYNTANLLIRGSVSIFINHWFIMSHFEGNRTYVHDCDIADRRTI